jgi:hypothetical protein
MKHTRVILILALALLVTATAVGQLNQVVRCESVGGVLMTNIGAIEGKTNLGPVFGDLAGSVAATIMGQDAEGNYLVQHYWVDTQGDTILFKQAVLHPVATSDPNVVAVLWGHYLAYINGGTGKYKKATGVIDCFGLADFNKYTLVLRYSGTVCR